MDHALLVSGFQRLADALGNVQGFIDGKRTAPESVGESVALDQFEDEKARITRFFDIVDCRDVGMIQRGEQFRFTLESADPLRDRARTPLAGS
jgi:hypothetical protein